jgi:hypothetical protein
VGEDGEECPAAGAGPVPPWLVEHRTVLVAERDRLLALI